jgi:hypothetical protein
MAMGTPHYAQFQSESLSNGVGGIFDVPNFDFWFNPTVALGDPLDLQPPVSNDVTSVPGVSVEYPLSFNANACAGTGESCFWESA